MHEENKQLLQGMSFKQNILLNIVITNQMLKYMKTCTFAKKLSLS